MAVSFQLGRFTSLASTFELPLSDFDDIDVTGGDIAVLATFFLKNEDKNMLCTQNFKPQQTKKPV